MREKRVKRAEKQNDIDDGRVIASMNVDGMPWYSRGKEAAGGDDGTNENSLTDAPVKMTFRENIAFMSGVIKAALLVSLAFIGSLYLFILFCVNVWFK